jgi:signal transduction histidine kinase
MSLAAFIASHIEDILREWVSAANTVAPPRALSREALRDHWAEILKAIADEMSATPAPVPTDAEGLPATALRAAASAHGARRQAENFEIDELVAEFRAMRSTVLQAWVRSADGRADLSSVAETSRFCEALDRALAESIDRHLRDRARARELFLAMLGHDLRAPLSSIQMAAHILDRPALEDTARLRAGGRIRRSLQEMAHLITDLIDFTRSRLGAGLPISKARCDLAGLANDALDTVRASFAERRFEGDLSGDLVIDADPSRMSQLLSNLLYNAVQHGDPVSTISLRAVGHADHVVVQVHNMGAPIPAESVSALFEPMVQAAKAASAGGARSNTSMGLGLYIVREIARGHGGTIDVESSGDAGTTFTLHLPRHPQAPR